MSNNKQQTAVEWLEETMLKPLIQWPDDIWEQAKEMEKQQIIKARYSLSKSTSVLKSSEDLDEAINYYNETYGGNK
jgi:hypothetical protein